MCMAALLAIKRIYFGMSVTLYAKRLDDLHDLWLTRMLSSGDKQLPRSASMFIASITIDGVPRLLAHMN